MIAILMSEGDEAFSPPGSIVAFNKLGDNSCGVWQWKENHRWLPFQIQWKGRPENGSGTWGGFHFNRFLMTMSKGKGATIIRSTISPQLAAKTRLLYNPLGQLPDSQSDTHSQEEVVIHSVRPHHRDDPHRVILLTGTICFSLNQK